MTAYTQDISVGPVEVDTGDNWLDFGFVVTLVVLATVCYILAKRYGK